MSANQGKNVVITGASKGIGRAIAAAFAAEGARLFLCARNQPSLTETAIALQQQFPQSTIQSAAYDLSVAKNAEAFGHWVNGQATADIIINNAGSFEPGSVYNEPEGLLEKMIATNLYSAYHVTRTLLAPMLHQKKGGYIFNICSIASLQAYPNGGSYSISKYALLGFSKNLREEMKPHGIKVCAVMPGAVLTDSWGNFDNSNHRIMEANDIADIILAATKLSPAAVLEDVVLRPSLGDLL